MGFASKRMMKLALVLLALAAVDAHMTEPDTYALSIPAPPGEDDALAMIDEGAGAVTKYRVTWPTNAPASRPPTRSTRQTEASSSRSPARVAQQRQRSSPTPVRQSSPTDFTRGAKAWSRPQRWTQRRTLAS